MLKQAATAFGAVFLLIGVLGFIPGITTDDKLLGLFQVNTLHNLVHILSGIAALAAARSEAYARTYFQVFGAVYALVTLVGFVMKSVLGLFPVNPADNLLHLVIAAAALYLGFLAKNRSNNAV